MTYIKLDDNGVVIQKQPNEEEGFIEAPDDVVCGMIQDGEDFVAPSPTITWGEIRSTRDILLSGTDWAVLPDSPHNTQAILDYRQALRDLPKTFATPDEVVWPVNPLEGK